MESAFSGKGGGGDASNNLSNALHLPKTTLLNKLDLIAKGMLQYNLPKIAIFTHSKKWGETNSWKILICNKLVA